MKQEGDADYQMWVHELGRRDAERAHDRESEFGRQNNEAAISTGTLLVRTAILINGGAAVAILGFMGALVGKGGIDANGLGQVAGGLTWFSCGVALAAFAMAIGYVVNYLTAAISNSRKRTWEHPYVVDGRHTRIYLWIRAALLLLAVIVAVFSLLAFIGGTLEVKASVPHLHLSIQKSK